MKKTLLLSIILFMLCSAPGPGIAQPMGGNFFVNPLTRGLTGPGNGAFDFHTNPSEDHSAFESLEHHSYQYYALHGYEHYRSEGLQPVDRFKDIQYPKDQPYFHPNSDSFFGVESSNPLK